jgi:hypothetical protein
VNSNDCFEGVYSDIVTERVRIRVYARDGAAPSSVIANRKVPLPEVTVNYRLQWIRLMTKVPPPIRATFFSSPEEAGIRAVRITDSVAVVVKRLQRDGDVFVDILAAYHPTCL